MSLHLTINDPKHERQLRNLLRMTRVLAEPRVLLAVLTIKEGLDPDADMSMAAEAYAELSRDELSALWVAPSKGGIWTTREREMLKGSEFVDELRRQRDPMDTVRRTLT